MIDASIYTLTAVLAMAVIGAIVGYVVGAVVSSVSAALIERWVERRERRRDAHAPSAPSHSCGEGCWACELEREAREAGTGAALGAGDER